MSRGRDTDERDGLAHQGPARLSPSPRRGTSPRDARHLSLSNDERERSGRSPERDRDEGPRLGDRRRPVGGSGQSYRLRKSEFQTLEDIGRFRTVAVRDLREYRYGDGAGKLRGDLRSLIEQSLVEQRYVALDTDGTRTPVVTLTEQGKALMECESPLGNETLQRFYAGFVKPAEMAHDAALYRMFQAEAGEIERQGGAVERVVLDYELKGSINRELNADGDLSEEELDQLRHDVAAAHHLPVADRKIPLPDLRIEYSTAGGAAARVDLELATEHYKNSQIAAKASAGFKVYMLAPGGASGGSPVRDEREITAGILSI